MLLIFQRRIERNGFNANQVAVATPVTPVVALVENDTKMNSTRAAKKKLRMRHENGNKPMKAVRKKNVNVRQWVVAFLSLPMKAK